MTIRISRRKFLLVLLGGGVLYRNHAHHPNNLSLLPSKDIHFRMVNNGNKYQWILGKEDILC